MSIPATEKRQQLIRECRKAALLLEEGDIEVIQSDKLEALFVHLKSFNSSLERSTSGQEQSSGVLDDPQNTGATLEYQNNVNQEVLEVESDNDSSASGQSMLEIPTGMSDMDGVMKDALDIAKKSLDDNTKVGAVIIAKTGRVLSTGFNHMPGHSPQFPWKRISQHVNWLESKYPYVVHAQVDAINNCERRSDLCGALMITTLFPGHEAAKQIVEAGIKHVWYLEKKYEKEDFIIAGERILKANRIEYMRVSNTSCIIYMPHN